MAAQIVAKSSKGIAISSAATMGASWRFDFGSFSLWMFELLIMTILNLTEQPGANHFTNDVVALRRSVMLVSKTPILTRTTTFSATEDMAETVARATS
jgi:hypothetical protein